MKSFALHLVVVFILGVEFQPLQSFCSSSPAPAASTTSSPSFPLPSVSSSVAQRRRFAAAIRSTNSSTSSSPPPAVAAADRASQTSQNAVKTSRTIQRLVAGHLHHSSGNTVTEPKNTTSRFSNILFRRKAAPESQRVHRSETKTTVLRQVEQPPIRVSSAYGNDADYRDEAFLDDTNDIDGWDDGILRLSAGAGKDTSSTKNKKKEDSKKTLSDQVKDGKYGLIENELFRKPPKRPGIISYLSNKEVPDDTEKNYGGLKEEDIWLAEDHLLVLKGGSLNSDSDNEPWHPIDDYQAPGRQIKIPPNPKVPPPFPVQLEENGPLQFIGDHKFPFFYPDANGSLSVFSENGYESSATNGHDEKNLLAGPRSSQNVTRDPNAYAYPQPYAPWLFNNETFKNPFLNFGPPQPGPFPNDNGNNDYIDEDDPSLYYPPPYSFVYESNYSNPVKPGPLVPGIVLPPPPNAFARLEPAKQPQRKPVKTISFNEILNKITEERPEVLKNVITTTEVPATTVVTTNELHPVRNKEVYYVRQKTRPYSAPTTPPQQLPPATTSTTRRPETISFVPQISTTNDPLSTGNPIYYEYFDARRVVPTQGTFTEIPSPPRPTQSRPVQSVPPVQPTPSIKFYKPQKYYSSPVYKELPPSTRPPPQIQKPYRVNKLISPTKAYDYNEYLYITPKPEIYPNGISNNFVVPQPFKIQQNFEQEVDAIRQTLQHYKTLQLQSNYIPRQAKTKPVYEYSFAASGLPRSNDYPNGVFTPPTNYDPEPFKPMLQYSRPVDDANAFKAMAYPRTDNFPQTERNDYYTTSAPPAPLKLEIQIGDDVRHHQPSSTLRSIDYTARDQRTFAAKPSQYNTPTTVLSRKPWVSIEKQLVQELHPTNVPFAPNQKDINRSITGYSRNVPRIQSQQQQEQQFQGYYYSQPIPRRPNHRFQQYAANQQPFAKQVGSIREQLSQYRQQPLIGTLENDTFVNNLPGRIINPEAEYINVPPRHELFQQQRLPPPQGLPPQRPPLQGPGGPYRQPVDIESDILVNYRLPLPPINPDSEFIRQPPPPQYVNRNPQNFYQQRPPPQYGVVEPRPNNRPPNLYYVRPERDARLKNT